MSKPTQHLGDAPIEPQLIEIINGMARLLDRALNEQARGAERTTGFALLVFPFNDFNGRVSYISNGADRHDIVALFKEVSRRLEGAPDVSGIA